MAGGWLGDEGCDGGFVSGAGCHPGQGDFFAGDGCGGGLPAQQGVVSPRGAAGVCVDFVFEVRFAGRGQVAVGLAARFDAVGQGACQVGQRVDGGRSLAQHVAYGALTCRPLVWAGALTGVVWDE